jgi:hypothetical protein
MTTAEQAAALADLLLIPTLRIEVDAKGNAANTAQLLFAELPDGTVMAEAYTTPERLVTARGEAQPWAAMRPRDLAALLDSARVDGLVVDFGSPDGYLLAPDGECLPLPTSPSSAPTEPRTDLRREASDATGLFE